MSPTSKHIRLAAAVALTATLAPTQHGPQQEQLVKRLITELRNPALFDDSADKLTRIGAPAVSVLMRAWRDPSTDPGESISVDGLPVSVDGVLALEVLGRMGPDAANVLTTLVESLPTVPKHLQGNVASAIAEIAPYAEVEQTELRRLLAPAWKPLPGGEWSTLRGPSGWHLAPTQNQLRSVYRARCARLRKENTPALIKVVADPRRPWHAEFAAELLGRRRQDARIAVPALQDMLRRYYPYLSTEESFAPRDIVNQANPRLLDAIADALVAIDPAEGALAQVHRLHDQDPRRRRAAALALGDLGPKGATAVPYLTSLSRYGADRAVAADAITALGMLGPLAADAVPALEYVAQGDEKEAAQRAAAALRQIRGKHD